MIELLASPEAWLSLTVLTAMEIVLGIDNLVFITILCGRLPEEQQHKARRLGLAAALIMRILLLLCITWVMGLTETLFHLGLEWSGKDLILLGGGLFLLYKATQEIYHAVEYPEGAHVEGGSAPISFAGVIIQVMIMDIVFSLDSVITAVGMADHLPVMIAAVLISVGVMIVFAGAVGDFVQAHPSVRVLALAFLVLIGTMLVMESTGAHVSKGYIYASMGFSLFVEALHLRRRKQSGAAGRNG
jgi:predicted tellurium resistance membrane protein TerC